MRKHTIWLVAILLLLIPATSYAQGGFDSTGTTTSTGNPTECPINIDFEGFNAGDVITTQIPGVTISATGGSGEAMIFDSSDPTGGDRDLGSPNETFGGGPGEGNGGEDGNPGANDQTLGKILIISEDGDPDDNAGGGQLIFVFDAPADVADIGILDVDNNEVAGTVMLYDESDNLLKSVDIQGLGDNSYQLLPLDQDGVKKLVVDLPGSGAVTGLRFCQDPEPAFKLGDFIWEDFDGDGIQDANEPGIKGVELELYVEGENFVVDTTTTDANGAYHFLNLPDGNYVVKIVGGLPQGYQQTVKDANDNDSDEEDSDFDGGEASATIDGADNRTVDGGFVLDREICVVEYKSDEHALWLRNFIDDDEYTFVGTLTLTERPDGTATLAGEVSANNNDLDAGWMVDVEFSGRSSTTDTSIKQPKGGNTTEGWYFYTYFTGTLTGTGDLDGVEISISYLSPTPYFQIGNGANDKDGDYGASAWFDWTVESDPTGTIKANGDKGDFNFDIVDCYDLGDRIWRDNNLNGVQDDGEAGIADVEVELYDADDNLIATTTTDADGEYLFENLVDGDYTVVLPDENFGNGGSLQRLQPTRPNIGDDDEVDSDFVNREAPGEIDGANNLSVDGGFYRDLNLTAECVVGNTLYWRVTNELDVDVPFTVRNKGIDGIAIANNTTYFETADAGNANTTIIDWLYEAPNGNVTTGSVTKSHNNNPCVYHVTFDKEWTGADAPDLDGATLLTAQSDLGTATCTSDDGALSCVYSTGNDLHVPFGKTYSVSEHLPDGWAIVEGIGTGFTGIDGFDMDALPDDLVYDVADDRFCESNPNAAFPFNLEKFCEHTVINASNGDLEITKLVDWAGVPVYAEQTFTVLVEGPDNFSEVVTFNANGTVIAGTSEFNDIPAGEYTVTEIVPPRWMADVAGTDTNTATVMVVGGETTTVTVENTLVPPQDQPCGTNLVVNGSFEAPEVVNASQKWDVFVGDANLSWNVEWATDTFCQGVRNLHDRGVLELQEGRIIDAFEGNQYAELDSDCQIPTDNNTSSNENALVEIAQLLPVEPGKTYTVSFYIAERNNAQSNGVQVTFGGLALPNGGLFAAAGQAWELVEFQVEIPEDYAEDFVWFTIEDVEQDGTGNSLGMFVDDVSVVEECEYTLGDTIFFDDNENGLRDMGEAGVEGVELELVETGATTTTDTNGFYEFTGLLNGSYTVKIVGGIPAGYDLTEANVNGNADDAIDSDFVDMDGMPVAPGIIQDMHNPDVDGGIVRICTDADINPEHDLVSTSIKHAGNGVWYAEVTNNSDICEYRVGMASYEKNGNGGLSQQVLFDSDPKLPDNDTQYPDDPLFDGDEGSVLEPGETARFEVTVPDCQAQLDVFYDASHLIGEGESAENADMPPLVLDAFNTNNYGPLGNRYGERLLTARHIGDFPCDAPEECTLTNFTVHVSEEGEPLESEDGVYILGDSIIDVEAKFDGATNAAQVKFFLYDGDGDLLNTTTENAAPYEFLGGPGRFDTSELDYGEYKLVVTLTQFGLPCGTVEIHFEKPEPTGTITVVKRLYDSATDSYVTDENQSFAFTGDLGDFDVSAGGSTAAMEMETGSYTITELTDMFAQNGYALANISISGDTDGDSTKSVADAKATIDLDGGEDITVTFTNVTQPPVGECIPDFDLTTQFDGHNMQGVQLNGSPVPSNRSNFSSIFDFEGNTDSSKFFSLGYKFGEDGELLELGGSVTLVWADDNVILPQELGPDLVIWETTFNDLTRSWDKYKEQALVEGSMDGVNFFALVPHTARKDMVFDLPAELLYAKYIRITDTTYTLNNSSLDAFDIDAVQAYGCGETPTGTLTIIKDAQPDATWLSWEFSINDEAIPALVDDGVNNSYTDGDLLPGTYTISETNLPGNWDLTDVSCTVGDMERTVERDGETISVEVGAGEDVVCTFTNQRLGQIFIEKYNDANGSGAQEDGEGPIAGVEMSIFDSNGDQVQSTKMTDANGKTQFTGLEPGDYTVCETVPAGYSNTQPGGEPDANGLVCQTVAVPYSVNTHVIFGNQEDPVCPIDVTPSIDSITYDEQTSELVITVLDIDEDATSVELYVNGSLRDDATRMGNIFRVSVPAPGDEAAVYNVEIVVSAEFDEPCEARATGSFTVPPAPPVCTITDGFITLDVNIDEQGTLMVVGTVNGDVPAGTTFEVYINGVSQGLEQLGASGIALMQPATNFGDPGDTLEIEVRIYENGVPQDLQPCDREVTEITIPDPQPVCELNPIVTITEAEDIITVTISGVEDDNATVIITINGEERYNGAPMLMDGTMVYSTMPLEPGQYVVSVQVLDGDLDCGTTTETINIPLPPTGDLGCLKFDPDAQSLLRAETPTLHLEVRNCDKGPQGTFTLDKIECVLPDGVAPIAGSYNISYAPMAPTWYPDTSTLIFEGPVELPEGQNFDIWFDADISEAPRQSQLVCHMYVNGEQDDIATFDLEVRENSGPCQQPSNGGDDSECLNSLEEQGSEGEAGNGGAEGGEGEAGNGGAEDGEGEAGNGGAEDGEGEAGNGGAEGGEGEAGNGGAEGGEGEAGNGGAEGGEGEAGNEDQQPEVTPETVSYDWTPGEVCWVEDQNGATSVWEITNPNPIPLAEGTQAKVLYDWATLAEDGVTVLQSGYGWDQNFPNRNNTNLAAEIRVRWYVWDNGMVGPEYMSDFVSAFANDAETACDPNSVVTEPPVDETPDDQNPENDADEEVAEEATLPEGNPVEVCWVEDQNNATSVWRVTNNNTVPLAQGTQAKMLFNYTIYDGADGAGNVVQPTQIRHDQIGDSFYNTPLGMSIEVEYYVWENDVVGESRFVTATANVDVCDAPPPGLGTGDVQATLQWASDADYDLHVIDPAGEEIAFFNTTSDSGGQLDVDANAACATDSSPNSIENIFWPEGSSPTGTFVVFVDEWRVCDDAPGEWTLTVRVDGEVLFTETGTGTSQNFTFSVDENGVGMVGGTPMMSNRATAASAAPASK